MIRAGKLRFRVAIRKPVTPGTKNAAGEKTTTPATAPLAHAAADVRQMKAEELTRNGINATTETYAIRIRWRADVDATCVIMYGGKTLALSSVVPSGRGNREWLDIIGAVRK